MWKKYYEFSQTILLEHIIIVFSEQLSCTFLVWKFYTNFYEKVILENNFYNVRIKAYFWADNGGKVDLSKVTLDHKTPEPDGPGPLINCFLPFFLSQSTDRNFRTLGRFPISWWVDTHFAVVQRETRERARSQDWTKISLFPTFFLFFAFFRNQNYCKYRSDAAPALE